MDAFSPSLASPPPDPLPYGTLSERDAEDCVGGICFKTGPPGRVGVELEWLLRDRFEPVSPSTARRCGQRLAPLFAELLPGGGRLTWEPGGQLELSSAPGESLAHCLHRTDADLRLVRAALAEEGVVLQGRGLDPYGVPARVLDYPRYRAMEAHFDHGGPWGRVMMRATAALQINLDAGDDSDGPTGYRHRWRLAHRLGPVLVAAFANSPLWKGRPTGWASTRQGVWALMDPARTRPAGPDGDPRAAWSRYALDAPLLCLRRERVDGAAPDWTAPRDLTFRDWLRGGCAERPPTRDDLTYHLSTLFPPVRPRGWLELRMIDAQHGDGWIAAAAIVTTLLDDPDAARAAQAVVEQLDSPDLWLRAARHGPADPRLGPAVRACVSAAEQALSRSDPGGVAHRAVAAFAERYADRGRCPADDCLASSTGAST